MEIIKKLQDIGLTLRESKVYLFLLEHQESRTGKICSKLNIPSSHIYKILEKLQNKGLISFKIINNIKTFYAVSPEALYVLFEEKEKQLSKEKENLRNFISKLKKIEPKERREADFKYAQGSSAVKSLFIEFMEKSKTGSTMHVSALPKAYDTMEGYAFNTVEAVRVKKKFKSRLLLPERLRHLGVKRKHQKQQKIKYSHTELPSGFTIIGDRVFFASYRNGYYALMVEDKNLAETQKKVFDVLWDVAKD